MSAAPSGSDSGQQPAGQAPEEDRYAGGGLLQEGARGGPADPLPLLQEARLRDDRRVPVHHPPHRDHRHEGPVTGPRRGGRVPGSQGQEERREEGQEEKEEEGE